MNQSPIQNATDISVDLDSLENLFQQVRRALGISRPVDTILVESAEMVRLNTQFRNCTENTDVLTFPSGLHDPLPLGDIAICIPYANKQATLRSVSLDNEIVALYVHGCLHLLGYDDIDESDRTAMQHKMNEVGQKIGIPIEGEWTSILHQDEHE
ncbi:MAG: rRNA maturation RNase YbeY [Armatimonadota bacterium]